ncbi:MAG TPA: T9SS type A sorting domain-containing protein [Flavobacteriaceae bacterium]|nr:T9SS type A sorting domain-containing protein [Flavobacteriaceae bacterium]
MKSILTFLCFAFCFAINAQNPELFNHTWYLQKMVVNATDHFPPSNSEVQYVDLNFYDVGNNTFDFETTVCNSGGGGLIFDNGQSSFNFTSFAVSLETCQISGNNDFEQFYFFDFYKNHENDPFSYGINTENNGSKTLTITNIVGDQAIYNNVLLSTNQLENRSFAVFPNPVKNVLSVESNSVIERIVIYDIAGKKALSFVKKSASYDISALQNGIYFLEIVSDQGSVFKKILKK